jgi:hypothetical protein
MLFRTLDAAQQTRACDREGERGGGYKIRVASTAEARKGKRIYSRVDSTPQQLIAWVVGLVQDGKEAKTGLQPPVGPTSKRPWMASCLGARNPLESTKTNRAWRPSKDG